MTDDTFTRITEILLRIDKLQDELMSIRQDLGMIRFGKERGKGGA